MNCLDCKHKRIKFSDITTIEEGFIHCKDNMYVRCELNNQDKILEFYKNNGSKQRTEIKDEMDCFVPTVATKILDNLLRLSNEVLTEFKK
jgi:hypothetical protein